jgi:hypothetical protein
MRAAICLTILLAPISVAIADVPAIRIATFVVDVTPPLGAPLCDALVPPADRIVDPLSARGLVLFGDGPPIVLCAVDWVGIGNSGHDTWRAALARAAGTTDDRVMVHTLHQHDAPGCDFTADELAAAHGLGGKLFPVAHARESIARSAAAVEKAIKEPQAVTHVGFGTARVREVASNRRLIGPSGRVERTRMSSCRDASIREAPEGVIDPDVRLVTFYGGDRPLAVLSFYATHPQSYYGRGDVSADFVGLARTAREEALPGTPHVHFNGAGGNVAAGKYNDGSPENRLLLAGRLAAGMRAAWEGTSKTAFAPKDIRWSTEKVVLPPRETLDETKLRSTLADTKAPERERLRAARDLTFLLRAKAKHPVTIGCLQLGDAAMLFMPGELFVEYQLAAAKTRPGRFVAMAAYGDYGPGYIGTKTAYGQGGYETSYVSRVSPDVEDVLTRAAQTLLK